MKKLGKLLHRLFKLAETVGVLIGIHGPRATIYIGPLEFSGGFYRTDDYEFRLGLRITPYEHILGPISSVQVNLGWFCIAFSISDY